MIWFENELLNDQAVQLVSLQLEDQIDIHPINPLKMISFENEYKNDQVVQL